MTWSKGSALTAPASELVGWFEAQRRDGAPRMTRVAIVMQKGTSGWSTRGVKLGSIEVHIIDSALGRSMAMRAQSCSESTCPFIVEGFWKGESDGEYHYEIRNAPRQPATPEELAAFTHAEVASGN